MPESKDLKWTRKKNQNIPAAILKKEVFDISYPDVCLLGSAVYLFPVLLGSWTYHN